MYKGQIKGFPQEVVEKMLERQVEQGNKRDVSVFEGFKIRTDYNGGFDWSASTEGQYFWSEVIDNENFSFFFEKYPKKELPRMVMVSNSTKVWRMSELIAILPEVVKDRFVVKTASGYAAIYASMKEIEAKPIPEYTMQELQDKIGEEFKLKK